MSWTGETVRVARTRAALETLLGRIERGERERPDWIHLQAECRLDQLERTTLEGTLARLHGAVRRGFRAGNLSAAPGAPRLALWRSIARGGFHDFGNDFVKNYDSPFVEDHDYVGSYLEKGLDGLDPYRLYAAVLGSHDYGVEDFLATQLCAGVRTIVEPMAGTAEFTYRGHFRFPEFRYLMIDLDVEARDHVMARPWLPGTEHLYLVADVLDDEVWKQAKSQSSGPSLAYVGKQSHHLFDARQVHRLLELGTLYADYLVLETAPIALVSDMWEVEELTRDELRDAGLHVALVNEPGAPPNPFTNRVDFRLDAWDASGRRTLFRYPGWTVWPPPFLVGLAQLLDLNAFYFHSELEEFVPVDHDASDSDCHENPSFMLFTRHRSIARSGTEGVEPR